VTSRVIAPIVARDHAAARGPSHRVALLVPSAAVGQPVVEAVLDAFERKPGRPDQVSDAPFMVDANVCAIVPSGEIAGRRFTAVLGPAALRDADLEWWRCSVAGRLVRDALVQLT
jgi:hypothetical protein